MRTDELLSHIATGELKMRLSELSTEQIMTELDNITKSQIVEMILEKQTEKALEKLSEFYHVTTPQVVVGTIKGKRSRFIPFTFQRKEKSTH